MPAVRALVNRFLTPGRLALTVVVGVLALTYGASALAVAQTPAGKLERALAAAKKKKAKKKKTCIIHRYTGSGKKVVFKVYVYQYKTVRRNGRKVRTIVKKKVPLRGSCSSSKACVKVKVTAVGKVAIVYSRKKVRVRVKKGNKLVYRTVKKKVPVLGKCVKPGTTDADLGVPVKITILPSSKAHLDFGSFTRDTPIGGTLKGYSPQPKIDITKDIPIVFTSASVTLGSTPIFIDQDCNDRVTAALRTGKSANVILDGSRESTSLVVVSTGQVTATTFFKVRLPLELRDGEQGCDKPYIDTQYSEWPLKLFLTGKINPKTGLTKLEVKSAPLLATDLTVCLNPGLQTEPCSGFQIPLPIFISTDVFVKVDLNAK
jgi:hypothetical protein